MSSKAKTKGPRRGNLGRLVVTEARHRNLPIVDLARSADIAEGQMRDIIRGRTAASPEQADRLALALWGNLSCAALYRAMAAADRGSVRLQGGSYYLAAALELAWPNLSQDEADGLMRIAVQSFRKGLSGL